MMGILEGAVDSENFFLLLIGLVIIGYFVYKEWPEFQKRVSKKSVDEKQQEFDDTNVAKNISEIKNDVEELKKDVKNIKDRQNRDYGRLNAIEQETARQKKAISESLEERKLLMRGIMACLDGLEQQGCNHIVPATKRDISNYLNDVAHS